MDISTIEARLKVLLGYSYAPYSGMHFACLVESADGALFEGTNVENASFGATVCAERNAINAAVSAGKRAFKTLYLMGEGTDLLYPCALCHQCFLEFFDEKTVFYIMNTQGFCKRCSLAQVLVQVFTKQNFKAR